MNDNTTPPNSAAGASQPDDDAQVVSPITRSGGVQQELLGPRLLDELASQTVIHVSTNARGRAQFDLRLPYTTIGEATERVTTDIGTLIQRLRMALNASGLLLAGDDDDAGHAGSRHAGRDATSRAQASDPTRDQTLRKRKTHV